MVRARRGFRRQILRWGHTCPRRQLPVGLLVGAALLGLWCPSGGAAAPTPTDLAVAALRSLNAGPYQARFSSATTVALTGAGAGNTRSETDRAGRFTVENSQRALLTVETGSLAGLRLVGYDGVTYAIGTDGSLKRLSSSLDSQLFTVRSFLPPSTSAVGRVRDLGIETTPRPARHLQVRLSRANERAFVSAVSLELTGLAGGVNPKHLRLHLSQDLYLDPDTGRALAWTLSVTASLPGPDVAPEAAVAAPASRYVSSRTISLELEDTVPAAVPPPPANPATTSSLSALGVGADASSSPPGERRRGEARARALARRVNEYYNRVGADELRWRDEDGANIETFRYDAGHYTGSALVYGAPGARYRALFTRAGTFARDPKATCWARTAPITDIGQRFFNLGRSRFEAPYRLGRFLVLKASETYPGEAKPVRTTYLIDPKDARVVADLQNGTWDYHHPVARRPAFPVPSPVCAG